VLYLNCWRQLEMRFLVQFAMVRNCKSFMIFYTFLETCINLEVLPNGIQVLVNIISLIWQTSNLENQKHNQTFTMQVTHCLQETSVLAKQWIYFKWDCKEICFRMTSWRLNHKKYLLCVLFEDHLQLSY